MSTKDNVINIADRLGMEVDQETIDMAVDMAGESPVLGAAGAPPLQDSEIDEISKTLDETMTEEDRKYASLPSNSGLPESEDQRTSIEETKKDHEGATMVASVVSDPNTGKSMISSVEKSEDVTAVQHQSISDIMDGKLPEIEASESAIAALTEMNNISTEEAMSIIELIKMMNSDDLKDTIVYDKLPESIKKGIVSNIPIDQRTPIAIESISRNFLEYAKSELQLDKVYVDFQEAVKKELDIPDYLDMYLENICDVMEKQLPERAESIRSTQPQKAAMLDKVSAFFTLSYNMELLDKEISKKGGRIKTLLNTDLLKYEKHCNKFNREYTTSKYNITDIRAIAPVLDRKLPDDISMDDIKRFVLLFIRTTKKMYPSDQTIHQHTYMYYFIQNIVSLDHINQMKTEFSQQLLDNIVDTINKINQ